MHSNTNQNHQLTAAHVVMMIVFFLVLGWSSIKPHDYFTWILEVMPALIGFILLIFLWHKKFYFSTLAYVVMLSHAVVLMVGGHYTYAEVPLFDWLREPMGWERNNYDKLGHFMQGFSPALIATEVLWRKKIVQKRGWVWFLSVCVCMAISACYELIEWWVALLTGESAEAFLGTQGYVWDTQADMMWCLIGAISMILLLFILKRPSEKDFNISK